MYSSLHRSWWAVTSQVSSFLRERLALTLSSSVHCCASRMTYLWNARVMSFRPFRDVTTLPGARASELLQCLLPVARVLSVCCSFLPSTQPCKRASVSLHFPLDPILGISCFAFSCLLNLLPLDGMCLPYLFSFDPKCVRGTADHHSLEHSISPLKSFFQARSQDSSIGFWCSLLTQIIFSWVML